MSSDPVKPAAEAGAVPLLPTLEGVTLEQLLTALVARFGWEELGRRITIACFTKAPSLKSSLKFLRRTPWARQKVEQLYLQSMAGHPD